MASHPIQSNLKHSNPISSENPKQNQTQHWKTPAIPRLSEKVQITPLVQTPRESPFRPKKKES
jgi:hypothetical protein